MTLQDKIQHTKAIADAIQRADKSYDFEVEHGSGLFITLALPTSQVAGTIVQQRSYAYGKAMEILNTLSQ